MAKEEDDREPVVEGLRDGNSSGCLEESEQKAPSSVAAVAVLPRKDRRKAMKKEKRKQKRKEAAEKARQEEEARLNDPEEQRRIQLEEEREKERMELGRREFEEKERLFLEALARKKAQELEEEDRRRAEEAQKLQEKEAECEANEDGEWEYVEDGPPEIIWQGNEIIVKKNKVKVKKKALKLQDVEEDPVRPTSNPLLSQSEAFVDYRSMATPSAPQLSQNIAQQVPNFGTEQDKAHCPFHFKTGACKFGSCCSRDHFYPDRSCTLLIKNMYKGPGLEEEFECMDEEAEHSYEEFYNDVHSEFLRFGEIVNFKVCRNGSHHLRGNVYVQYASVDDAVLAFHATNGRYFAQKQLSCEFVHVTKWKVAICGEYMKSKFKTCSRGTACNFIHCFRNPDGDYEWANWDKPPPKHWAEKNPRHHENHSSGRLATNEQRYRSQRSQSTERKSSNRSPRDHSRKDEYQSSKYRKRRRSDDATRPDTYEREYEEEQYPTSWGHENKRRQHESESDIDRLDRYHDDGDGYHDQRRRKTSRHLESPDGREIDGEEHHKYPKWRSRKDEREYEEEQYPISRGHENKRRQYDGESDKDRSDRYYDDGDGYRDRRRSKTSRHLESPDGREIDGEEHHKYPKRRSRKDESDHRTKERSYDTDTSREHSYENRRSLSSKDHLHRKRRIYGSDSTGYSSDESAHTSHGRRRRSKTHRNEPTNQQDLGKSKSDLSRSKSSRKKEITKRDEKIETVSPQQTDNVDETRKQRKRSHGKSRSHDRVDEHWEESRSRSRSRKSSSRTVDSDGQD